MKKYIKIYSPKGKKPVVECDFKDENELPEENTKEFFLINKSNVLVCSSFDSRFL